MTLKGHIQNGQVVLDEPANLADLADGTPVRIEIEKSGSEASPLTANTVGERLLRFSGLCKDLPADLAENHDHYAHGAPKRSK